MNASTRRRGGALSLSLRLGTAYDWLLALSILLAPPALMRALAFPPPADSFLFKLTAMPLVFFPLVYLAAAADPGARPWAVRLSLAYRLAGGALLGGVALWAQPPGLHVYLLAALADLVWGGLHALLWRRGVAA